MPDQGAEGNPTKIVPVVHGKFGVVLATHLQATDERLRKLIAEGTYEVHEGQAVRRMLVPGDVVVELGAGLGLISTLAAQTGPPKAIHCYEADLRMVRLIRETHRLNGVTGVTITHAAITADAGALAAGKAVLHVRANFWANSLFETKTAATRRKLDVPAVGLSAIVADIRPTVIICDIEGAEDGLFDEVDLSGVRHVLVELHPKITDDEGVARIFAAFAKARFVYDTVLSAKALAGFTRIGARVAQQPVTAPLR